MTHTTYLGFPRIGRRRELKRALEKYWHDGDAASLLDTARTLRQRHWQLAKAAGIGSIPVNDFSLYDHVLDTAVLFDAVPDRYRSLLRNDPLAGYFAMARGNRDLHALEMTKWFDTNYHYIVPELHAGQRFRLTANKPLAEWLEARGLGVDARPVLLGPVSFLRLSKTVDDSDALNLLDALIPAYIELLEQLAQAGVTWVQLDEPCLVQDLDEVTKHAYTTAYSTLAIGPTPKRLLATYFGGLGDNLALATSLPVDGLHIDLVRAPEQLDAVLAELPKHCVLSAGVIDGRNIWRSHPSHVTPLLEKIVASRSHELAWIAPSCSLLHVPIDAAQETSLPADLLSWLSFAQQKLEEIRYYADALNGDEKANAFLVKQTALLSARTQAHGIHRNDVRARVNALSPQATQRRSNLAHRRRVQADALSLPPLPTTTIGSFPQTDTLRHARAEHRAERIDNQTYETVLREEIERAIRFQERIGLDVLVHGEPERNDMVEYFGEQLEGFAFTRQGWVQSYGSRCVKPPIIWGDVSRPKPMTVQWSRYAQSLTDKPVKGMLTGPVTVLQWSFVRDDLPRDQVCLQLALALRDEVHDLEKADIHVIQIDEPALREGLPIRHADHAAYLDWAVRCFRITAGGTRDATQIHTHMCYSEFNDIIEAVAALDADVISIESSRSRMELLQAFEDFHYPGSIGPGVYDIHSPRVPSKEEMVDLLERALTVLEPGQLWVNPDCGLKTRGWKETEPALTAMVNAAQSLRAALAGTEA
ncbi:5-methyltetrahydropteroyltriglutamate--homocysteine S-methyltransferase [Dyella nitratireducens]|uniref:5-methyltetrahydropteroyltriglutamate--homocysteine methyltransferase n=1 Tax=Dyella nitratireducens TaxID=1849580 RepID=A0ABQ1GTW5_9GAMM|nr:5-methyltetrahydropteroyltriglutamate--homocysteine S-methyltransferase [Dyella nitratireducens]GGA50289.1 5-methyltetrahydropteroyltriglutamate--homocysteine methyltransferase [Dyella nitratireducens]GLQ42566.1 5-methyltetrahydropteroyltriglutamate--homocysteine methyltransferase [Dyella nitratireducens]